MRVFFAGLLGLLLSQSLVAQPGSGDIDYQGLTAMYGEPRVMINLGGPLMKLISAAASAEDPEAAAILKDLEGIRVNVYDTDGNIDPAMSQLEQAKAALEDAQWQPIVQVREEGENVQMFTRIEDEKVQGMAIMVVNPEEAVFINIIGQIDPAEVGRVMNHLNVDVEVDEQ